MPKWEYCEVECQVGFQIFIRYYRPNGSITHGPERCRGLEDVRERAKQLVAHLGLEGWELVNAQDEYQSSHFWLKRPFEGETQVSQKP